jgi:hypothetical protein
MIGWKDDGGGKCNGCDIANGYAGINCTANYCGNGRALSSTPGTTCSCLSGWSNDNSGGICNVCNGNCVCPSGFAGPTCQYSDAVTCKGRGTANYSGTCSCTYEWYGANCEKHINVPGPIRSDSHIKVHWNWGPTWLEIYIFAGDNSGLPFTSIRIVPNNGSSGIVEIGPNYFSDGSYHSYDNIFGWWDQSTDSATVYAKNVLGYGQGVSIPVYWIYEYWPDTTIGD